MADIELILDGTATGAVAAFNDAGEATDDLAEKTGKAAAKWAEMAAVAKKAAEAVIRFGVDSVKMYAESERVQRQLTRAAGEYGDALGEVAKAQSRLYAVDDDVIKQSQTLLVQWGGLGAASKEVTQAVLDYASATGQDAVSATRDLIRNVESGGVGLAKMGVHFKDTGDKGKNLSAIVEAVSKKFGGSAAADAGSLVGTTNAARLAFEDLQKAFGGLLATVAERSGVLSGVTTILRDIATGADVVGKAFARLPGFLSEAIKGKGDANAALLSNARDLAFDLAMPSSPALPGLDAVSGATNKALKGGGGSKLAELHQQNLDEMRQYQRELDQLDEHARQRDEEAYADELARSAKIVEATIKEAEERVKVRSEMLAKIEKENADHLEKMAKEEQKAADASAKAQAEAIKKREQQWRQAGDTIGAAFVNALADQLAKLAQGGELDPALFVGDVLAATVGTAATVIGTMYGAPAVGAALGNLAAVGIRAGASSISAANKKGRASFHDGGWVGAPRYHDGTWVGSEEQRAILLNGERVLSRNEVRNAGGPRAVDAMARGGGSRVNVYVSAIDSRSVAESAERDLGKGVRRALRSGRGDLPALFGVPR